MSNSKEKWKISDIHKQTMSSFMTDFWDLIKASYEFPDDEDPEHDHYWSTLVKWCDALMTKYRSNKTINGIVCGFINGQSYRATGRKIEDEANGNPSVHLG